MMIQIKNISVIVLCLILAISGCTHQKKQITHLLIFNDDGSFIFWNKLLLTVADVDSVVDTQVATFMIKVSWITNEPCYCWVEYGEDADKLSQKAKTVNAGLVKAFKTIHAIIIQKMKPGKNIITVFAKK